MSYSTAEAIDQLTAVGSVLKILLSFLAIIIIIRSWPDTRIMLSGIKRFKLLEFEVELNALKDAFQKQVEENKIRQNNSKTKDAGIGISDEKMHDAIKGTLRISRVFLGADILWIGNDPLHDFYFRKLLRYLGVGVESARSTQEAVKLIAMNKFDLLISDINKPDDNEIQGLYHLRKQCGYKSFAIFCF